MKKHSFLRRVAVLLLGVAMLLSGCGGVTPAAKSTAETEPFIPYEIPEFHDSAFHEDAATDYGCVQVDSSCLENGYIAARAVSKSRLKFQVICGGTKYNYDIPNQGEPAVFPLNMGNGTYECKLMESVGDSKYVCTWSKTFEVTMVDEFQPYLRPNQMSNYGAASACAEKARELAASCQTDTDVVAAVYEYLVQNITYDNDKAATITSSYLPDPDATLASKTGICFDYASLAAAMFRSLGIPCRLITGFVDNEIYHAWNCIYLREQGWITVQIMASPNKWQRVDITFAAGGTDAEDLLNDAKYTGNLMY